MGFTLLLPLSCCTESYIIGSCSVCSIELSLYTITRSTRVTKLWQLEQSNEKYIEMRTVDAEERTEALRGDGVLE